MEYLQWAICVLCKEDARLVLCWWVSTGVQQDVSAQKLVSCETQWSSSGGEKRRKTSRGTKARRVSVASEVCCKSSEVEADLEIPQSDQMSLVDPGMNPSSMGPQKVYSPVLEVF